MTTRNPSRILKPQPHENVATESLDEGDAFAGSYLKICPDRTVRNPVVNPYPDAGVDVALFENRPPEVEFVIRRVGERAARIEGAPGCAPDIPPGAELTGQGRRQHSGRDGAILERCGIVVCADDFGELL